MCFPGVIDIEGNPKLPAQMSYRVEFSEPVLEKVNFYAVSNTLR